VTNGQKHEQVDRISFMDACAKGGAAMSNMMQRVYVLSRPALFRDAYRSLRDEHAAAEVVQLALTRAWERCSQFAGRSELMAWLRSIMRSALLDRLRQQPVHDSLADEAVLREVESALLRACGREHPWDPQNRVSQAQVLDVFEKCFEDFRRADPTAAAVIRWVVHDSLDTAELSALLGRTEGATRQYLAQCRKKARLHLAPFYALMRGN
jgi:RNA polymerase sigma factor (sigma-70 family)